MRHCFVLFAFVVVWPISSRAQQTIFNVPSADVLARGATYGEFDLVAQPSDPSFAFAPRVVVGVGHNIEGGLNFLGVAEPATGQYILSPAAKWKFYDGGRNGWTAFGGDNVFIPVRKRTYDIGTYAYVEVAKRFGAGTRVGVGAYYFSPHVVDHGSRAGGQFSLEQKLSSSLTLAADWYTGKHADGFVTPGFIWNLTKKLTVYGAYEVGNSGVSEGNHGPLVEIGYTF